MANRLRINVAAHRIPAGKWDPDRYLAEALAERDRFLNRYPKYKSLQREIDSVLDKAGSSENRMAVLALLMEAKLLELHNHLQRLNRVLLSKPS